MQSLESRVQVEALFKVEEQRIPAIVYAGECSCGAIQIVRPFDRLVIVATPEEAKHRGKT